MCISLVLCFLYWNFDGCKGQFTVSYHQLILCLIFLHAVMLISLDCWARFCTGSGNTLFQRRMSTTFKKTTNVIPEGISWVTATVISPIYLQLTPLPLVHGLAYSYCFPPLLQSRFEGRATGFVGGGVKIAIATALLPAFFCTVV